MCGPMGSCDPRNKTMTLDKALELIQKDIDDEGVEWNSPLGDAYKMSFEALKRCEVSKCKGLNLDYKLLPGETKEEQPTREEVKKYMAERAQGGDHGRD